MIMLYCFCVIDQKTKHVPIVAVISVPAALALLVGLCIFGFKYMFGKRRKGIVLQQLLGI